MLRLTMQQLKQMFLGTAPWWFKKMTLVILLGNLLVFFLLGLVLPSTKEYVGTVHWQGELPTDSSWQGPLPLPHTKFNWQHPDIELAYAGVITKADTAQGLIQFTSSNLDASWQTGPRPLCSLKLAAMSI